MAHRAPRLQHERELCLSLLAEGLAHRVELRLEHLRLRREEVPQPRLALQQQLLVLHLQLLRDRLGLGEMPDGDVGALARGGPLARAHRVRLLPDPLQPVDDDLVVFLLGCSFSFEEALIADGLEVRNISEGVNVPMYRTNIDCTPAGPFVGEMVVSMRPFGPEEALKAVEISGRFPSVHGEPIHYANPAEIGIKDINQPDYGDKVSIKEGEHPLFWACGVTPQVALENAKPPFCITHSPGYMLVTDMKNTDLEETTCH